MKRFFIAILTVCIAFFWNPFEAQGKKIRFPHPKTGKPIPVQYPVYFAHGMNSSNQTWGRGHTKCFVHAFRQQGYEVNENLFMVGVGDFGDTELEQEAFNKIQFAVGNGMMSPLPAVVGPLPFPAFAPVSVLNNLPPENKAILLYQGMGFPKNGNDSSLKNQFMVAKDTKAIMEQSVPELQKEGIKMSYGELQKQVQEKYPDFGLEGIAHSNGGRVLTEYTQQTDANGYKPVQNDYVWDYKKGKRREEQVPSKEELAKDPSAHVPKFDNSLTYVFGMGVPVDGSPVADKAKARDFLVDLANFFTGIPSMPVTGELMTDSPQSKGGYKTVKTKDGKKVVKIKDGLLDKELNHKVKYKNAIDSRGTLSFIKGKIPGDGYTPGSVKGVKHPGETQWEVLDLADWSDTPIRHTEMTSRQEAKDAADAHLNEVPKNEIITNFPPDDNEDISSEILHLPQEDFSKKMQGLAKVKGKENLLRLMKVRELEEKRAAVLSGKSMPDPGLLDAINEELYDLYPKIELMGDQIWREYQEAADVAILKIGSYVSAARLIRKADEPAVVVPTAFDPMIYTHKKILIIPSAGLQGYESSNFFKARLDEFVKQGGVIICFTQPFGYQFGALPPMGPLTPALSPTGGEGGNAANGLGGLGYQQDQNCYYKGSYLDQVHPILKNQQDGQIDVYTDGYFTFWPQGALTPVRRAKNDAPIVVIYPYGKGWVCATTLYLDWGFTHQQFSKDEEQLIKDLVAWAKDPNKPLTEEEKSKLKFEPRQKEDVQMFITSDSEEYAQGTPALFTVHVQNNTSEAKECRLYWAFPRSSLTGRGGFGNIVRRDPLPPKATNFVDVKVPAKGQAEHSVVVPVVVSPETMWAYLYDAKDEYLATASRTFWMVRTNVPVTVQMPSDLTKVKGFIPVTVVVSNPVQSSYGNVQVQLTMVDPKSQKAFDQTKEVELGGKETKALTFEIPRTGKSGFYTVLAEVRAGEEPIGLGSGHMNISEPVFNVAADVKETTDAKVRAEFQLKNIGAFTESKGTFKATLVDPSGKTLRQVEKILDTDGQTEFGVSFVAENIGTASPSPQPSPTGGEGALQIGDYRLIYEFVFGDRKIEGTTVLPNQILVEGKFDKVSYDAQEKWRLDIGVKNVGRFGQTVLVNVKIPGFGYENNIPLTLASPPEGGEGKSSYKGEGVTLEGIVPDDAAVGAQVGTIDMQVAGAQGATATFSVRGPNLCWVLAASEYKAGDILHFSLSNKGGVPTKANGTVSLEDLAGNTLAQQAIDGPLSKGQSSNLDLKIPGAIKSGPFMIIAQAKDGVSQRTAILKKAITLKGLEASIDATLSKESLDFGENLEIEALLKSLGLGEAFDGVLKARIIRKGLSPPERWDSYEAGAIVSALASDGDDVWIALHGNNSQVLRYSRSKKKWKAIPRHTETFYAFNIQSIVPAPDDVWFVGAQAGVSRYDKKRAQWVNYFGGDKIQQVALDGDEAWLRGTDRIHRLNLKTKEWRSFRAGIDLPYYGFTALAARDGQAWLATPRGVYRYDKAKDLWEAELPTENILAVAIGQNDVWVGIDQLDKENGRYRSRVGRYDRSAKTWSYFYNTYQEQGQVVSGNSNLPSTQIDHIAVDTDWVWFGGTTRSQQMPVIGNAGICRYNASQDKWGSYLDLSFSYYGMDDWTIGKDYVAVSAQSVAVAVFNKAQGGWKVYPGGQGPLTEVFRSVALAESGAPELWVQHLNPSTYRLSKLDLANGQWESVYAGLTGTIYHPLPDGDGDLWFWTAAIANNPNANVGVTHYDPKKDEWEHVLAGPEGLLDNKFFSLWPDGKDIWVGHASGMSRYSKKEGKWLRYYGKNYSGTTQGTALPFNVYPLRGIQSDPDGVWFFTGHGYNSLYRFNKADETFKEFDIPLPESHLMRVVDDAVWIGSVYRSVVLRLDKKTGEYKQYSIDRNNDPNWHFGSLAHIIPTPQDVWFLTRGAEYANPATIIRCGLDLQWTSYRQSDVGMRDISYGHVFQRGDEFLFRGNSGLMRLNDKTGTWSVLHAKKGELLHDVIWGMALHGSEIWLGTGMGINIWEPEKNIWRTFPTDISGGSFQVNQFVFGSDPAVVWAMGVNNDLLRFRLAQDNSKPLWAKEFQVKVGQAMPLKEQIKGQFVAGEYELVLELYTEDGQILATASKPFSVKKSGPELTVTTDKALYRVGETAVVDVGVTNGPSPLPSPQGGEGSWISVGLFYGDEEALFERQDFAAGETKTFQALITAAKGKVLRAVAGGTAVERTLDVRQPQMSASIKAPDVAGQEEFAAEALLDNTGDADLELNVDLTGIKNFGHVTLPAGQKLSLSAPVKISADTDLELVVSGDLFQSYAKKVVYGVKVAASADIPAKATEGVVPFTWTLENVGPVAATTSARLKVLDKKGTVILEALKNVRLEKGQKFSDKASGQLVASEYGVELTWDGGQVKYALAVVAKPALKLSVQDKGFSAGNQMFQVKVENLRDEPAKGMVRRSFAGVASERAFAVDSQGSVLLDKVLYLGGLAAGEIPIALELWEEGRLVTSWSSKVSVPKGDVKIVPLKDSVVLPVGTQGKIGFQIINETSTQLSETFSFSVEGLTQESRTVSVGPYQTGTQEFTLSVPDDFPQTTYLAQYQFQGKTGSVPITVVGPKVEAAWSLDKPAYVPGQTASLTLRVKNMGQPWPLEIVVRYKEYQASQTFQLEKEKDLMFEIPLQVLDGEKIFCAINTKEGRSLYINRFDVPASGQLVEVTLDKQDYSPGQTVTINVAPKIPGTIRLASVHGFAVEKAVAGPQTFQFKLPDTMAQQTYFVDWEFAGETAKVPFNVRGDLVRIISGVLKRSGASCIGKWKVVANRSMAARLVLTLAGDQVAEVVLADKEIALAQGQTDLEEMFGWAGMAAGVTRVRAAILIAGDEGPAAVFEGAVDEGSVALLAAVSDKAVYLPGETVRISITSFGDKPTPLKLLSSAGQTLYSGTVKYNSVAKTTIEIGSLSVGEHSLNVLLGDVAAGSSSAVPVRVVIQQPPAPVQPVPTPEPVLPPGKSLPLPGSPTPSPPSPITAPVSGIVPGAVGSAASTNIPSGTQGVLIGADRIKVLEPVPVLPPAVDEGKPQDHWLGREARREEQKEQKETKHADVAAFKTANPWIAIVNKPAIVNEPDETDVAIKIPPGTGAARRARQIKTSDFLKSQQEPPQVLLAAPALRRAQPWRIAQIIFLGALVLGASAVYARARRARRRSRKIAAALGQKTTHVQDENSTCPRPSLQRRGENLF